MQRTPAVRRERISFLDCPIDSLTMDETIDVIGEFIGEGGSHAITVANANKLWQMQRDARLRTILCEADLVIPEWAVVWGAGTLGTPLRGAVYGVVLFRKILEVAPTRGWSVYFLGARPEVTSSMVAQLTQRSPGLRIAGHQHGYFAEQDRPAVIEAIRAANPDVLFVAMGSPKQEYWIQEHAAATGARIVLGVGGSFDVLSGKKRDTPDWARGRGLEWLYRLWLDPGNLWKRYLITNSWFVWRVFLARISQLIGSRQAVEPRPLGAAMHRRPGEP